MPSPKDPKKRAEWIKNVRAAQKKRYENPEERKRTSDATKKAFSDPAVLKKLRKALRNPARRKKIGEARLAWLADPKNKAKHEAIYDAEFGRKVSEGLIGVPKSDLHKESMIMDRWRNIKPGPDWFRTTKDFIHLACEMYNLKQGVAHRRVKKVLKEKGLTKLDLLLFINFTSGHNRDELSEHYKIGVEEVVKRLRNFEEKFPTCFQSQTSAGDGTTVNFIEWMDHVVKYQF